jgi:hypothetical protein
VLRSFSSSTQSIASNSAAILAPKMRLFAAQAKFGEKNYKGEKGPDLHYVWPRRTPHRPPRPARGSQPAGATRVEAGVLRPLLANHRDGGDDVCKCHVPEAHHTCRKELKLVSII